MYEIRDEELHRGDCKLFLGPMGSNKTTQCKIQASRLGWLGRSVVYIGSNLDTRSIAPSSTHNSQLNDKPSNYTEVKLHKLREIDPKDYEYIFIDEGQFFTDLYEMVTHWVVSLQKKVIVMSLNGDSDGKLIGEAHRLIPIASDITILTAVCKRCLDQGRPISDSFASQTVIKGQDSRIGQFKIGGFDLYESVCIKHSGLFRNL